MQILSIIIYPNHIVIRLRYHSHGPIVYSALDLVERWILLIWQKYATHLIEYMQVLFHHS